MGPEFRGLFFYLSWRGVLTNQKLQTKDITWIISINLQSHSLNIILPFTNKEIET